MLLNMKVEGEIDKDIILVLFLFRFSRNIAIFDELQQDKFMWSLYFVAVVLIINPRDEGREGRPQAPAEHAQVSVCHKWRVDIQVEVTRYGAS